MFGMRHGHERYGHEGRWAGGRHWRRHGGGFGWGRRGMGGDGDGDMMRAGRMLAQGDLRLIALALIAEQPRHGYEIIKVLEDKTEGWYSPSPGMVYPTLTYLEEAGYVSAQAEGSKRLYTITQEGRDYLAENKAFVDAVLERLGAIGAKFARARRRQEEREDERNAPGVSPLVRAALMNLREVAAKQLDADPDAEPKVVDVLARAAAELKRS
jgi:DNA-binding PadR family transcriptional regulator